MCNNNYIHLRVQTLGYRIMLEICLEAIGFFCFSVWWCCSGADITQEFAFFFYKEINYFTYPKGHITAFSVHSSPDLPWKGKRCQLFVLTVEEEKQICFSQRG